MQTVLLDVGTAALAGAIAGGTKLQVVAYHIGQGANFQPQTNAVDVAPVSVFAGDSTTISPSLINNNEIRYTITLVEPVGPFNVGNIMLFLQDPDNPSGPLIPYLYGVLPVAVPKYLSNPPLTIGNRLVFNLTAMYTNVAQAFTLTITSSTLASLPNYRDEYDLPLASTAIYQQAILQNTTLTGAPSQVVRRQIDDSWFVNTFFQRLDDPSFGVMSGGIVGDQYLPFYGDYYAGGEYDFAVGAYTSYLDGGAAWGVPGIADLPVDGGTYS